MELSGQYSPEDFDKVRKALVRKRKRKSNTHWLPIKRKSKPKMIKLNENDSFNENFDNQNKELVKFGKFAHFEPVEELLKSDDESEMSILESNNCSFGPELENSVKPCVVKLERLQEDNIE